MWCKKRARQEKTVGAPILFTGKDMDESILIGPGNVNWPVLNGPGPFQML